MSRRVTRGDIRLGVLPPSRVAAKPDTVMVLKVFKFNFSQDDDERRRNPTERKRNLRRICAARIRSSSGEHPARVFVGAVGKAPEENNETSILVVQQRYSG